jgi:hypothetical protein
MYRYLDVGLSEGDHLRQYLRDMEVLHLVPLPRGLVQHVYLPHKVNIKSLLIKQCCGSGSGAFLTPGSGMGKKSGSGSGMNNLDHIS